ncbi:hypothetical protein BDV59DRAFT_210463 [Aspergillus ambiguus]|uniref:NAD(P)/FAD-dependent oxidoreductase n=1 Tax=Aspergillus ambiguus TaxID=176160 RepID=UPI003CCCF84B
MLIPEDCTVLVIGGGPGGTYTASVLALEGINTVLMEADTFPRYHIGESLLPSFRYFADFNDLYPKFASHGFVRKNGAAFRFNHNPDGYTDFLQRGGAGHHAWNVDRAEADNIMFQHAAECGAKAFDGVKATSIIFDDTHSPSCHESSQASNLGRPVAVTWVGKDKTSGTIRIQYIVDASGRAGIISTKYLKNRRFNEGLKNIATWGYFTGAEAHGVGTRAEGAPYFHMLEDGSGWVWFIPLKGGRTSVGVVMQQNAYLSVKKLMGSPSSREFFLESLKKAPGVYDHLKNAELVSQCRSTSDWSYSASNYSCPYIRIVGDAGCFIDPLFSSGVHLAMTGGLSAAVTICASLNGETDEDAAGRWHSQKVHEAYTRFLLIVASSYGQIHGKEKPILNDIGEENFDRAFDIFRPIIQGMVDCGGQLTTKEVDDSVQFCKNVIQKIEEMADIDAEDEKNTPVNQKPPSQAALIRSNHLLNMNSFSDDVINGMIPVIERGKLGLKEANS